MAANVTLSRMSLEFPKFHGFQEHKMDPKYRVAIPVAWRPEEGEELILQEASNSGVPCIRVNTMAAFLDIVDMIKNRSGRSPGEIRDALGYLNSSIERASVNSQGKLSVSKDWSLRANIAAESSVMLVGRGEYFDIYNSADYVTVQQKQKARVLESMGDLGIFS